MKIDFKIKNAPYNPRKQSKQVKERLKYSMAEFGDISGITINRKTGNIFTGNHRWNQLTDTYGTLELVHKEADKFSITKKGKYLGYYARVVDWELTKEKQANIVANSALVSGDFTETLQDQLTEIAADSDDELMKELGLSDIMIKVDHEDQDLDMDETKTELKRRKTVDDLNDEDEEEAPSPVNHIISSVKLTLPTTHKEEVLEIIMKALSKQEYYDEITFS